MQLRITVQEYDDATMQLVKEDISFTVFLFHIKESVFFCLFDGCVYNNFSLAHNINFALRSSFCL